MLLVSPQRIYDSEWTLSIPPNINCNFICSAGSSLFKLQEGNVNNFLISLIVAHVAVIVESNLFIKTNICQ